MKKILNLMVAASLLMAIWSCDNTEPEPQEEPQVEITTSNIAGSWRLAMWNNEPLPEGNFVYIDFVRSSGAYTMYQNIDSFGTRTITGKFFLFVDDELGASVLRGNYDHDNGSWNHRYIVESLTANTMRLVATDNPEDVSIYERGEIPSEIIE